MDFGKEHKRVLRRSKSGKHFYWAVRCPTKFPGMTNCDGYVAEHRFVMALYLGRALCKNEYVVHLDGDSLNNEISNLRVIRKKCKKK